MLRIRTVNCNSKYKFGSLFRERSRARGGAVEAGTGQQQQQHPYCRAGPCEAGATDKENVLFGMERDTRPL
jgi:hypothetical protein